MSGELNNEDWKHSNGAWIRTEIWACTHPALPERAIRFAFGGRVRGPRLRRGLLRGGVRAAIQSAAFVVDDLDALIDIGLSKIPEDCRVARSVRIVLDCFQRGLDWKACREAVVADSADLGWFQAPANVAFVILGLKYGGCDFKKSMILALNAATIPTAPARRWARTLGIMYGMRPSPKIGRRTSATRSSPFPSSRGARSSRKAVPS
jgi:hypothetical protein